MFEKDSCFLVDLRRCRDLKFKDLVELQEFQQKLDYFRISNPKHLNFSINKLPIVLKIHSTTMDKFHNSTIGSKITVDGYLEPYFPKKMETRTILKYLETHGFQVNEGFRTYAFYAVSSKIPTEVIIIAPREYEFVINSEMPHTLKIINLKRIKYQTIALLQDVPEPITLKIPPIETPYPVLTLKEIRKCITQISSLDSPDKQIIDALIAPNIGSDFVKKHVETDGIGSSYVHNKTVEQDVTLLNNMLKESSSGLSLQDYGIINISNKHNSHLLNIKRRDPLVLKMCNVFSWDIPSSLNRNNLPLSEYRMNPEGINIIDTKDIQNNTALQYSILHYGLLRKGLVSTTTHDMICKKLIDNVSELMQDKTNSINKIMDINSLPKQAGRVVSFYKKFNIPNALDVAYKSIDDGIDSILQDDVFLMNCKESHQLSTENIPIDIMKAYHSCPKKTKDNIIEHIMERTGWSEKRAEKAFDELVENGTFTAYDNVHYRFTHDANYELTEA